MNKLMVIAIFSLNLCACAITEKANMNSAPLDTGKAFSDVSSTQPKYESFIKKGQLMPVTKLQTIEGNTIDLAANDKRKLVILFATWCSDSQRAMSALTQSQWVKDNELTIIGIARENSIDEVVQFKQDYSLEFDLVADTDRSIYRQFASAGIPRFIMLDEKNRISNAVLAEGENQMDLIQWDR